MLISLILATKNRVKEVERFLQSLAAQSYKNFELIIVDQNLDDRLLELVKLYAQQFFILHIKQSKSGAARARNHGLLHVQGKVVAFPDDDCVYPLDFLAQTNHFFNQNKEWEGLIVRIVDLEEDKDAILFFSEKSGPVDNEKAWNVGMTAAMFLRRDVVDRVDGFDNTLGVGAGTPWGGGEDTDYLLRCLDAGVAVYNEVNLIVRHPTPAKIYTTHQLLNREYRYGRGYGFLMGKRHFSVLLVIRRVIVPFVLILLFVLKGQFRLAVCHFAAGMGRFFGYVDHLKK